MARTQKSPDASTRAGQARGRRPPSASGGARSSPLQRFADQRHPVIAEIHIGLVDENGRRAAAAARQHLVGIGLELVLDRLLADTSEECLRVDADALANFGQHRVLRNIPVVAPIGLEHRARERHHILAQPDAAAHRFHAVDRKYSRPHLDRKPRRARPVRHVFLLVVYLGLYRLFPRGIDAGVDCVEDAAGQDRPPRNLGAEFLRQGLDVVEGEIGPGAGTVEEEFDHGGVSLLLVCSLRWTQLTQLILVIPGCASWRRPQMCNCTSGNPYSRSWLWIPGSRFARPGITRRYFFPDSSFAACPNIFLRASSSKGAFSNLPTASPACT